METEDGIRRMGIRAMGICRIGICGIESANACRRSKVHAIRWPWKSCIHLIACSNSIGSVYPYRMHLPPAFWVGAIDVLILHDKRVVARDERGWHNEDDAALCQAAYPAFIHNLLAGAEAHAHFVGEAQQRGRDHELGSRERIAVGSRRQGRRSRRERWRGSILKAAACADRRRDLTEGWLR